VANIPIWAIHYGPETTDYGLRTTDYGPETTDYGLLTTDYWLLIKCQDIVDTEKCHDIVDTFSVCQIARGYERSPKGD